MRKTLMTGLMLTGLVATGMSGSVLAAMGPGLQAPPPAQDAPEIEVYSAGAALVLLAGGLIVLRGRRRTQ